MSRAKLQRLGRCVVTAQFNLPRHCKAGRTQALDDDVGCVNLDSSRQQFAAADQLPDVSGDARASGPCQHSLIIFGAQFRLLEVKFRSVPAKRRRHVREADVVTGLRMHPFLDLGLVLRRARQRELDRQHGEQHQNHQSCETVQQDFSDLRGAYHISTTSY